MIRPSWVPANDEQKAIADQAVASFQAADEQEERAWRDLSVAVDADVPIAWLSARIRRSRQTVYRRLKRQGQGAPDAAD